MQRIVSLFSFLESIGLQYRVAYEYITQNMSIFVRRVYRTKREKQLNFLPTFGLQRPHKGQILAIFPQYLTFIVIRIA